MHYENENLYAFHFINTCILLYEYYGAFFDALRDRISVPLSPILASGEYEGSATPQRPPKESEKEVKKSSR